MCPEGEAGLQHGHTGCSRPLPERQRVFLLRSAAFLCAVGKIMVRAFISGLFAEEYSDSIWPA